jgi:elongation factor G
VLDGVIAYLPSPLEVSEPVGEHPKTHEPVPVPLTEKGPLVALAFKVQMFGGRRHVYLKIYRGKISTGMSVWNPSRNEFERVGRLFSITADKRENLDSAVAGDIVLVSGFRKISTGDTLCESDAPVLLEPIQSYEPVMALAVENAKTGDDDKVLDAMTKMVEEDPTLRLVEDADSGQRLLRGMGELHLTVVLERMQREYQVEVRAGRPRVVYREGIAHQADGEGLVDRVLEKGGKQHARVVVQVTPTGYENGVQAFAPAGEIKVSPAEANLSETQRLWIQDTLKNESVTGPLQGYPLVGTDFRVVSVDLYGAESNEVALREATARAARAALQNADAHLLTPIMHVEVEVPSNLVGSVMGDLQSRNGLILGVDAEDSISQIKAECAMEKLFGYSTDLRGMTQGRGTFTLRFSRLDRA